MQKKKEKKKTKSRQNKQWIQHVRDRENMTGREHMCEWRIDWEREKERWESTTADAI